LTRDAPRPAIEDFGSQLYPLATWKQQSELTLGLSLVRSIEHDRTPVAILFDGTDGQIESARVRSSPVEWCNRFVILQGCGG